MRNAEKDLALPGKVILQLCGNDVLVAIEALPHWINRAQEAEIENAALKSKLAAAEKQIKKLYSEKDDLWEHIREQKRKIWGLSESS